MNFDEAHHRLTNASKKVQRISRRSSTSVRAFSRENESDRWATRWNSSIILHVNELSGVDSLDRRREHCYSNSNHWPWRKMLSSSMWCVFNRTRQITRSLCLSSIWKERQRKEKDRSKIQLRVITSETTVCVCERGKMLEKKGMAEMELMVEIESVGLFVCVLCMPLSLSLCLPFSLSSLPLTADVVFTYLSFVAQPLSRRRTTLLFLKFSTSLLRRTR